MSAFELEGRAWGIALHLYGLRSRRNWGIGDFSDLRAIAQSAARLGADLVAVNPLHALHWVDPETASPYAPTSRHFLNPLYVDVEAIPEFAADARTRGLVAGTAFQAELTRARGAALIDYATVAACKRRTLRALYEWFRRHAPAERKRAFDEFVDAGGLRLERFARYEALTERFARDGGRVRGWTTWPQAFSDPGAPRIARFARRARRHVDFFKYLQFVASEQLAAAGAAPGAKLFLDLAVGVDPNGADVWGERAAYRLDRTIGAPPDPLGPLGQNWGLVAFDPAALAGAGAERYAALLRDAMRAASVLRIDHVMSLMRLFLIPLGGTPRDGAYVDYPFETLLGVVARESAAARCAIVGEDLGTVPDGFRERMERTAILSCRILLFERTPDGSFRGPSAYPAAALATVTTHDLPTLRGWVLGRDLDVAESLGNLDAESTARARAARRVDATRLLEALRAAGELDDGAVERLHRTIDARALEPSAYAALTAAAYRFLAQSPARIVLVQLDDALGELEQVNVPGTFTQYANWRRKSALMLEDIETDAGVVGLAEGLRARIRGGSFAR